MIGKYGNYQHAVSEVSLQIAVRAIESEVGVIYAHAVTYSIAGRIKADTVAATTTALADLEAAYKLQARDFTLFEDDATTVTQHKILTANTMGGTRVTAAVAYPSSAGAEYTTYRNYTATIEADVLVDTNDRILSWSEEINTEGTAGPEFIHLPTLTGTWPRQRVTDRSTVLISQSGSAVGLRTWPDFPAPLIADPGALRGKPRFNRRTPRYRNGERWEHPISWSYNFEVATVAQVFPTNLP